MFERTPDRVSADLRACESANDKPEFTAEELAEAREEVREELAAGERIGKLDLEAILDYELDRNYAATLRNLYEHFAGIGNMGAGGSYDHNQRAGDWMLRLIDYHLEMDDEPVRERAAKIRADRDEDAANG